jgi:mannose-1-phosphate guanylyltransferase
MIHAVIMAGGVGTRFWPRSRALQPKQFLNILGERSMLQMTVDRLNGLVDRSRILVVTNAQQAGMAAEQLPELPPGHILAEPVGRNTAPCIGLAALHIQRADPEGVMVVLAADHLIERVDRFCDQIRFAAHIATTTGACVTIGIPPGRPETGYGYIQYRPDDAIEHDGQAAFRVKTFAEKPNYETARRFLESGDFLWNSGIFVWKASTIRALIAEFMPELHEGLEEIRPSLGTAAYDDVLSRVYRSQKSVSIDYGVMEFARDVFVVRGDFVWNDVGSWEEVYQLSTKDEFGNVLVGEHVTVDAANTLVHSTEKAVALVGVRDLIVVETPDALLICHRNRAQDVKKVTDELKQRGKNELL